MIRAHTAMTAKNGSAAGIKNYFGAADYYASGPETVGFWWGKLGPKLGLVPGSPVGKEDFSRLCDNINPATGKRLTLRTNEIRRVGDDLIFSLEKDFSVFIMMAPAEQKAAYLEMVQRRVLQVCDMIEADVQTRVRRDGAFENRPAAGMIFAGHMHTTARPVADEPPDPLVHWHMFGVNATWDGEEKRIKAFDVADIYRDSGYYDAVFKSLVAQDFKELGVPIVRRGDGRMGIAGMESFIPKFSKRGNFIDEEAARLNITDADELDALGGKTRSKKDTTLSPEALVADWDSQLTPSERETLQRLYRGDGGSAGVAVTAKEAVEYAIGHCSEKLSVIPERELMRHALMHGLGSVTPEQIRAEMQNPVHGLMAGTVKGEPVNRRFLTTQALKAEERELADAAYRGIGSVAPVGLADGLGREIGNGKSLNDEQFAAVTGLLESPNRINLVQGPAGAGKSSLLKKYDEGVMLAGQHVTYLASTAPAVEVLKKDGFDACTVASFLMNGKMQAAAKNGRVVVDETSMLGHKDASRLMAAGKANNLKFIFVGDPMQHGSVARGAFMRLLTEKGCIEPIRLRRIIRQTDPGFRAAAELFSVGKAGDGIKALDKLGWVIENGEAKERHRQIAGDYLSSLADGIRWKDVLVIAPTHAEARAVTAEIRHQLREAGKLGEERGFTRLAAVDTTLAERRQALTYQAGDVLVFHQNAKGGFTKGDRLTVADAAAVPLAEAGKFSVYRRKKIALAVGDVIRFTGNVQTLGGNPRLLRNGMAHAIAGFTEAGNIRLDSGDVISKDAAMLRHGFVETSVGSQGRTVRRALLAMSRGMGMAANMQQLYVSVSRAKEWVRVYADDKAAVEGAANRDSRQLLAHDLKPEPSEAEKRRQQSIRDHMAAWWDRAWRNPPEPTPPMQPMPPLVPPTHRQRHIGRQERGGGYER